MFPPGHPQAGRPDPSRRDEYRAENPVWAESDALGWLDADHSTFTETLNALRTGKALLATWADVDSQGEIVPYDTAVMCGDAAEWCYAMVLPPHIRGRIGFGTSFAAPRLGAMVYYLLQLWEDPVDVTNTLEACAIDVGAPGVDREFGQGVPSVDCPEVANREVQATQGSVRAETRSPMLDSMSGSDREVAAPILGFVVDEEGNAVTRNVSGFIPEMFVSDRYTAVGISRPFEGGKVTSIFGQGVAPLGVYSSLVSAKADSFFEVGGQKSILSFTDGQVSLVGAYGEARDGMNSNVVRAGLHGEWETGSNSLFFYGGVLHARGTIGVPGHADVSREPVSVQKTSLEARVKYTLRF